MMTPIQTLEMTEFCNATALVTQIEYIMRKEGLTRELTTPAREAIRQVLHMHRFHVFTYLTNSGVALPIAAIRDEVHVKCGEQLPDQAMPGGG